jgi:hypothetical protein
MLGKCLQQIDFASSDGNPSSGLVSLRDGSCKRLDEQAVVNEARAFELVDYIFFRRFEDGRSSQVAAFVVDNAKEHISETELAKLHHELWLHGVAPLIYVGWPSRVDILSCARGPDFWQDGQRAYSPADCIEFIGTAAQIDTSLKKRRRYSALRLADGTFWENPENRRLAEHTAAAHRRLIQAIVEADQELHGATNPVHRRLLVLMVLIKYLEDRRVFPDGWFHQFCPGAQTFFEVLKAGDPVEVRRLLEILEAKFNGDVFALSPASHAALDRTALKTFSTLVEAKTLNSQRYLWQQYSFEHLPVEVISRLYQRFVEGGHGAVYTPPYLVSLLLDHVMQYDKLTGNEQVLDPACGSGIFLVGAFRRLVNYWQSTNGWKRPDVEVLKRIVKEHIYGIELDGGAVDLTIFSMALAVCDALRPQVIWDELKFDPLRGSNFIEGDFFTAPLPGNKPWPAAFDVIVGNPPFESKLTTAGKQLNESREKERGVLPDNNAAYLFLERGLASLKALGRLCLIQPSGFLYNRKTARFRRTIFNHNHVETVFDLTSVRQLYDVADPKTIALLVSANEPSAESSTIHLTFRRTFSAYQHISFELDHYDRHRIAQDVALSSLFVWRANLLGGGRLVQMSQRFEEMPGLRKFVLNRNWEYGEGFIVANSGHRQPATFLTGKPLLPTDALSEAGIDESKITRVKDTHFRSAYKPERYSPPLVLIKANESLPVAFWEKGFLAFRDKIIGIHAEDSKRKALADFYDTFVTRRRLYQFCCALNGSQGLVGKATAILKLDVDALPFPENPKELELSFWEEAIKEDSLNYMIPFIRRGQNSELLMEAASSAQLQAYAEMFCRLLGSVYRNLHARMPIFLNGLICQAFSFGETPEIDWTLEGAEKHLKELIEDQQSDTLRMMRVLRIYMGNVIMIVKPDRLRYWIRSTAIRDADETIVDLHRQGY